MAKFIPPGFDAAKVIDGLHKAMGFGEPVEPSDVATFTIVSTATSGATDDDGIPFDLNQRDATTSVSLTVPCAIEHVDRAQERDTFGSVDADRIVITLLGPDYDQVQGFSLVTIGSSRYRYLKTDPPIALGSIPVWLVTCVAEDQR